MDFGERQRVQGVYLLIDLGARYALCLAGVVRGCGAR